jgi:putative peptidoglycan lipid II flippase
MSAWSLGILNSHRRFFISYAAPVIWNLSIIGSMLLFGEQATQNELAIKAAWGLVIGSFLQFAIQLPFVFKLITHFRLSVDVRSLHVKGILGNFTPVVIARGVVQISAYVDNMIASLLPTGTVAILGNAQTLYLLPISIFGMSVSAASLAEMSRSRGETNGGTNANSNEALRMQLERGSRHIAFFIFPIDGRLPRIGRRRGCNPLQDGQVHAK